MLTIHKTTHNGVVTFALEGRLDSASASGLETVVNGSIDGAEAVVFDFYKACVSVISRTEDPFDNTANHGRHRPPRCDRSGREQGH